MRFRTQDQSGPLTYLDYRTGRCRCGNALQPNQPVCPRCGRKPSLLFSGLDRLYEDDLDSLLTFLESKHNENPDDYMALFNLAGGNILNGDYETAKEQYKRVIQLNPSFPDAHLNLGIIYAVLGINEPAVRALKEYIRLDLHSPKVERVLRAISSIKNVPYEDTIKHKDFKNLNLGQGSSKPGKTVQVGPPGSLDKKPLGRRFDQLPPPPQRVIRKPYGPIDIFLILIIVLAVAAWYIFPTQSRAVVDTVIGGLEDRYSFKVNDGEVIAQAEDEDEGEIEVEVTNSDNNGETGDSSEDDEATESEEEDPPPPVVNANPATTSYWPLANGNQWEFITYRTGNEDGSGQRQDESRMIMQVVALEDSRDNIWHVMRGDIDLYISEENGWVYSYSRTSRGLRSKTIQIPYPPTAGLTHNQGQTVTVIGEETVLTAAGLFNAVKLEYVAVVPHPVDIGIESTSFRSETYYAWYAQGIGLVKYVTPIGSGWYEAGELMEYELN